MSVFLYGENLQAPVLRFWEEEIIKIFSPLGFDILEWLLKIRQFFELTTHSLSGQRSAIEFYENGLELDHCVVSRAAT